MRRRPLAKLAPPRLHDAVPRERLFSMLDDGRERTVTWVVGPPGAGKTTLVASWLERREIPAVWYHVDAGDADPGTFFHYLSRAAHTAKAQLPELTADSLARPSALARVFWRAWFAALPDETAVVFDNYQDVPTDAVLHDILEVATAEIPESVHLLCVSRAEPPGQLARLAASRQLAVVDWHALRLTLDETHRMAAGGYAVDAEIVRALHTRADGWAAGVTLMLERLRRNGILPEGAEVETREAVFSYFAGVMFDRLSREEQGVLLSVALLPHASQEQARQLSRSASAGKVLEGLYRNHLFTERQAVPSFVYRFHPLFRAFLLERGPARFGDPGWRALMSSAAELLEQEGQVEAAFSLFVELQAWDDAARVLKQQAPALVGQGRGKTVSDWIGHLPAEWAEAHPWCQLWLGVSLAASDSVRARAALEHAFRLFEAANDTHGMLVTVQHVVIAIAWNWGDYAGLSRWVEAGDALLENPPRDLSPAALVAGCTGFLRAEVLSRASHPRLRERVLQVLDLLTNAAIDVHHRMEAVMSLTFVLHFIPDRMLLARLRPVASAILDQGSEYGFSWVDSASGFAHALQRDGEHDRALALTEESIRRSAEYATLRKVRWFNLVRCLVFLARGDLSGLRTAFAGFVGALGDADGMGPNHVRTELQAILDLAERKFDAARTNAEMSTRLADATGFTYVRVRVRPLLAVTLAHCGRFAEAEAVVREGRHIAAGTAFWYASIEFTLTEAYLHLLQGQTPAAHEALRSALASARQRDDTWDFLDICAPFVRARLYMEALRHGIDPDLVRAIIRRHHIVPGDDADAAWPWTLRIRVRESLEVQVNDQPLVWGRKAPRKMLALLEVLAGRGGRAVPESDITDTLWPDEDGDVAHGRYGVLLMRLRRLLGDPTLLKQADGCLSFDFTRTWIEGGPRGAERSGRPPGRRAPPDPARE